MKTYALIKVDERGVDPYFTEELCITKMGYPVYRKELLRYAIDNAIEFGVDCLVFLLNSNASAQLIRMIIPRYYGRKVSYFILTTENMDPFRSGVGELAINFCRANIVYLDANYLVFGDIGFLVNEFEKIKQDPPSVEVAMSSFVTPNNTDIGIYLFNKSNLLTYRQLASDIYFKTHSSERLEDMNAPYYDDSRRSKYRPIGLGTNSSVYTFKIENLDDIVEAANVASTYRQAGK